MADFERRERFENAVIDMKDLTITEFTDSENTVLRPYEFIEEVGWCGRNYSYHREKSPFTT